MVDETSGGFRPDGRAFLTLGTDGTVKLRDATTGAVLGKTDDRLFTGHLRGLSWRWRPGRGGFPGRHRSGSATRPRRNRSAPAVHETRRSTRSHSRPMAGRSPASTLPANLEPGPFHGRFRTRASTT